MCGTCPTPTSSDDPPFGVGGCGQHWVYRDGAWKAVIRSTYAGVKAAWDHEQSQLELIRAAEEAARLSELYGDTLKPVGSAGMPWDRSWDPNTPYWYVHMHDRDAYRFWWYDEQSRPRIGDMSSVGLFQLNWFEYGSYHKQAINDVPPQKFGQELQAFEWAKKMEASGVSPISRGKVGDTQVVYLQGYAQYDWKSMDEFYGNGFPKKLKQFKIGDLP